jgi:hypothetical protein
MEIPLESIQAPACLDTSKQRSLNPAVKRSVGSERIGLILNESARACLVRTYRFTHALFIRTFRHLSSALVDAFKSLTGCCLKRTSDPLLPPFPGLSFFPQETSFLFSTPLDLLSRF